METSRNAVRSPVNPAKSEQTLVEYLQTIELPPIPSPPAVRIIDVLDSVYGDHPIVIAPTDDKSKTESAKKSVEEKTESVDESVPASDQPLVESSKKPVLPDAIASRIGFKLVVTATTVSSVGWLAFLASQEEAGILTFFSCQLLALCLCLISFGHPPDRPATTKFRIAAFALSVGWLPIIAMVVLGWPVFFVVAFAFILCFLFKLADEGEDEGLHLQN